MKFHATAIHGMFVVEVQRLADERGFFARTWCRDELSAHGLNGSLSQCSVSFNVLKGTIRGLHYQQAPHAETKIVRVSQGAIYDVVVDLRPQSSSFRKWLAVELSSTSFRGLYVPEGCAHGFQTLTTDAVVEYAISTPYVAAASAGVRWNDPAFGIHWPLPVTSISVRDASYADFVAS